MRKLFFTVILMALTISAMAQRTPTMGWSSWNTFALHIDETLIKGQADAMHERGFQKAGYKYVNIDDGYMDGRDNAGNLRVNSKAFPNGMRPLVDYIHKLGLKAGIYSDAGDNTCGSGNHHKWGLGVGLVGHEEQDCRLFFQDWNFDFIKVDFCGGRHAALDEQAQYTKISQAIKAAGKKDVAFNICRWAYPGHWVAEVSDSWRTTYDIYAAWKSVRDIIEENLYLSAYCHDGHYNDMDMLEVGRGMSVEEDKTHFGMWCIMSSPLLIGCDMSKVSEEAVKLMTNKDLIALNQDKLHLQAYVAAKQGPCFILVKDIKKRQGKTRAVAIYNPSDRDAWVKVDLEALELGGKVSLYDCFAQKKVLTKVSGTFEVQVPAHATRIYRAQCQTRLERKVYEAETAYLSRYQELKNNRSVNSAIYVAHENASGGYVAGWLGNAKDNDLQWRDVYVKNDGHYKLTFYYYSAEDRDMAVKVNGEQKNMMRTRSRSWRHPGHISINVDLKKGYNTVVLSNAFYWMPDIDRMEVEKL